MNKTHNYENNESVSVGIFPQRDGTFDAMTRTESRNFKTLAGAKRWLAKKGYAA